MNTILQDSADVRSVCAGFDSPKVLAYRLTAGPAGLDVQWTITFADTVTFSLDEPATFDLRFVGDWAQLIRAARAGREGVEFDPGLTMEGNAEVMTEIGPAYRAAQDIATLPVTFPAV